MGEKPFVKISFGSGGGFTGNEAKYVIDHKGNLTFSTTIPAGHKNIGTITNSIFREITKNATTLCTKDSFNNPGNIYYFIELEKQGCKKNFVWGNSDDVPSELIRFYDFLNKNTINFKNN
jgi:hypothetical protein